LRISSLPQTFQYAINLTKLIGKRYLWIGALCIIQDDEEKGAMIQAMGQVYENGFLTIIAASGGSADAGLPGIRPRSRTCDSLTAEVDGISLVPWEEMKNENKPHTPWVEREWTLQEDGLSRRRLMFAHQRVPYRCNSGLWAE
ncbi:heterokaryon incompatibility protein-domain-containing protein, partial [Amylocarpus encephaloides]